jgi:hypothetical protein
VGNLEENGMTSGIGVVGDFRNGGLVGSGDRDRDIGFECGFGMVFGGVGCCLRASWSSL